jgi:hypothetical protein
MRLKAKAQAARSKALEASDVRSMASQGYKFLIQRRTGGIDIKNGNARDVGGPSLPRRQRRAQAEQEDTTPKK